jgi:hypothetical protein
MATTYHVRPSELLSVRDNSYLAFCIDRAVWVFGTCLDADMDSAQEDPALGKAPTREQLIEARKRVFDLYMNIKPDESKTPPKGRYADPMVAINAGRTRG